MIIRHTSLMFFEFIEWLIKKIYKMGIMHLKK